MTQMSEGFAGDYAKHPHRVFDVSEALLTRILKDTAALPRTCWTTDGETRT